MDLCLQIYEDLWVERPDPGFRFCLIYTHSLSQSIHQTDILWDCWLNEYSSA